MNFIRNKGILYILIIVSAIDFTLPLPILKLKAKTNKSTLQPATTAKSRSTRQIVQPKWLNYGNEATVDPTVYVNPQSLFEAAEIRKIIQKAVNEDTYVVTGEEPDTNNEMQEFGPTLSPREQKIKYYDENGLNNWFIHLQQFWRNWTKSLIKVFGN